RQDRVGFVLVASPEPMSMREALFFHERLVQSSMPFCGFVINKVHEHLPIATGRDALVRALAAVPAVASLGLQPTSLRITVEAMLAAHAEVQVLAEADEQAIANLLSSSRAQGGEAPRLVRVPFFRDDIYSLKRLAELGAYLAG
ncbi:MAG TPA: hypothetical protein VNM90_12565, partial [Haliangium sp.]|nr:hypothetical protein [Haliangium sp.]